MSRVAIYRVLYGEDFIKQSINSIKDDVDHIFVFMATKPWGKSTGATLLGVKYTWPIHFDHVLGRLREIEDPKQLHVVGDQRDTPRNQNALLAERVRDEFNIDISTLIYMEPDQVFAPGTFKRSVEAFETSGPDITAHPQIELWKSFSYRIARRERLGAFMYNLKRLGAIPRTGFSGHPEGCQLVPCSEDIYNFGFCLNKDTMLWKHLTAIAFSKEIGDSPPNELWYHDKWLNWDITMQDLEISKGHEHTIKRALPFPMPFKMKEFMNAT